MKKIFLPILISTLSLQFVLGATYGLSSNCGGFGCESSADCYYTINSDKATYAPNETMQLNGIVTANVNGSSDRARCSAQLENGVGDYIVGDGLYHFMSDYPIIDPGATTNAAGTAGSHSLNIYLFAGATPFGGPNNSTVLFPYTVESSSVDLQISQLFEKLINFFSL